ncbi:FABP family protein [Streptomyces sp. NPDC047974]|uniref:FABP family protein n=1 Tax=Streptomyces sp. NPDC047974 TaxID=3154343 RepID=UPI0033FEB97C
MDDPYPDIYGARPTTAGPAAHPWLTPVLPLLGRWRGPGRGRYPTLEEEFDYEQELTFAHDGRPFLRYEARAWLLDGTGAPLRPSGRESGWLRVGPDGYLEALVSHPTGIAEVYTGRVSGSSADLATHEVVRTPLAKEVTAARRRYTFQGGVLSYTQDLAAVGQPLSRHLVAELRRVSDTDE